MTPAQTTAEVSLELAAISGRDHVTSGDALSACAIDGVIPAAAVAPGSADEISAILRLANQHGLLVAPAGGCTRQRAGRTPERIDILLQTTRLSGVVHYDPGDLTVGFGAGTTVASIQQTLAANGQFLPLDVKQPARSSIGGVLAANAHGPMKSGYGGVRDYCIGVEFITGEGKPGRGGGRVVKNVAGYDLMKLLIGSFGTLGVITSASFKVFPRPRQTCTFACEFELLEEAIQLRNFVNAGPLAPMCLEIVSPRAQEYLSTAAPTRDPDHHHPAEPIDHREVWTVFLRAAGSDAVIARYRRDLASAVTRELSGGEEEQLWSAISDFEYRIDARHRNAMLLHMHMARASVETALLAAGRVALEQNMMTAVVGRASAGALVAALMPLSVDPPSAMQYANAASALRAALPADASVMVMSCPVEAKSHFDVWGSSPQDLALMRGVRQALDPNRILNRGRFLV